MDVARHDVALVRWPTELERLDSLRELGVPRLLVLDRDTAPPASIDVLEDWVRRPVSEADIRARIDNLVHRAGSEAAVPPGVDNDGVMRYRNHWTSLPPVEARIQRTPHRAPLRMRLGHPGSGSRGRTGRTPPRTGRT